MVRLLCLTVAATLWADPRCTGCHQSIVASYQQTGKARSISKPRAEVQSQRQWYNDFAGRRVGVTWQNGRMTHWFESRGSVEGYEVDWAVGSGRESKSYIVRIADSLFQSPIAWYANRLIWDMAPGYAVDPSPSFYRPLASNCLNCHAGEANPIPGTQSRFGDPPIPQPALSCSSCHGDSAAHLALPGRGNIVNPAALPRPARDAVCDSCHLPGEARVLNPGKRFSDYVPGMPMEDVFSIYVARKKSDDTILRVYSQAEELASSPCSIASEGKLWCGTCHDSHRVIPEKERPAWYRDQCLNCHQGESIASHRREAGDDCVRCHMPKQRPYDGSHASRTDHWIRIRKSEARFLDRGELLRPWREPPAALQNRNLALAYLSNAERTRSLKRHREGLKALDLAIAEGHRDGEIALAAGVQFLRQKAPDRAIPWLQLAVEEEPDNSLRRLQLALALLVADRKEDAKMHALAAVRIEPLLEQSYAILGQIEPSRAAYWKEQYRKAVPKRQFLDSP